MMPNLNNPHYRRDYTSELIVYEESGALKTINVVPRDLPHGWPVKSAIVLGNGIGRLDPTIELICRSNRNRPAEGYKLTYACNAAYRDVNADYYVVKDISLFQEIDHSRFNQVFVPYNLWLTRRDTNMIPYYSHLDAGTAAAYLAAFDGAEKVFLFGFDGTDGNLVQNVYQDTLGYKTPAEPSGMQKFAMYMYDLARIYPDVQFYRVRTEHSFDWLCGMPLDNWHEVSIRQAVLLGDF
jgi:hypothetical protein